MVGPELGERELTVSSRLSPDLENSEKASLQTLPSNYFRYRFSHPRGRALPSSGIPAYRLRPSIPSIIDPGQESFGASSSAARGKIEHLFWRSLM